MAREWLGGAQFLTFSVAPVKKGIVQINYHRTAPLSSDYQQSELKDDGTVAVGVAQLEAWAPRAY
jgi:hypothetical protein